MEGKRLLSWIVGGIAGAGTFLVVYYFGTYSIIGGDVARGLILPGFMGAIVGGMLAGAVYTHVQQRRRGSNGTLDNGREPEQHDGTI